MSRSGFTRRWRRFQPFNKFSSGGGVPAHGSFDRGYITATGQSTVSFVGRAAVSVVLSVVASGVFAGVGNAQPSGTLPADILISGSSSATFAGAIKNGGAMFSPSAQAGDLLATGYGSFDVVGSTNEPIGAALSALGVGAASINAASTVRSALASNGIGLATFGGLALSTGQGALSGVGTGLMNVIGAAKSAQSVAMSAVSSVAFVGAQRQSGVVTMIAAATASFVGAAGGGAGGFTEIGSGSQRARFTETTDDISTAVFPANVTAGNLLIAAGTLYLVGTNPTITAADTVGSTLTVIKKAITGGNQSIFIVYGIANASGPNTITLTNVGTENGDWNGVIDEFSAPNATPLNVDGGLSEGTSTTPSDAISTTVDNALIVGIYVDGTSNTGAITANDGTLMAEDEDGSTSVRFSAIFLNAPTQQAYTIDWTLANSGAWGVQTASFSPP